MSDTDNPDNQNDDSGAGNTDQTIPLADFQSLESKYQKQQAALGRVQKKLEQFEAAEAERLEHQAQNGNAEEQLSAINKKLEDAIKQRDELQQKYSEEVSTNTRNYLKDRLYQDLVVKNQIVDAKAFPAFFQLNQDKFGLDDQRDPEMKELALTPVKFAEQYVQENPFLKAVTQARGGDVPQPHTGENGNGSYTREQLERMDDAEYKKAIAQNPDLVKKRYGLA